MSGHNLQRLKVDLILMNPLRAGMSTCSYCNPYSASHNQKSYWSRRFSGQVEHKPRLKSMRYQTAPNLYTAFMWVSPKVHHYPSSLYLSISMHAAPSLVYPRIPSRSFSNAMASLNRAHRNAASGLSVTDRRTRVKAGLWSGYGRRTRRIKACVPTDQTHRFTILPSLEWIERVRLVHIIFRMTHSQVRTDTCSKRKRFDAHERPGALCLGSVTEVRSSPGTFTTNTAFANLRYRPTLHSRGTLSFPCQ